MGHDLIKQKIAGTYPFSGVLSPGRFEATSPPAQLHHRSAGKILHERGRHGVDSDLKPMAQWPLEKSLDAACLRHRTRFTALVGKHQYPFRFGLFVNKHVFLRPDFLQWLAHHAHRLRPRLPTIVELGQVQHVNLHDAENIYACFIWLFFPH